MRIWQDEPEKDKPLCPILAKMQLKEDAMLKVATIHSFLKHCGSCEPAWRAAGIFRHT